MTRSRGVRIETVRNYDRSLANHGNVASKTSGALIGLLAGGVSVGVGQLVAALFRPAAAPVIAVGNRLILLTPESVKRWAIKEFGTGDKHALLTGIYLGLGCCAVLVGIAAVRRLRYGLVGIGLLGALGVYCALTTAAHRGTDAIPSVLGALAGLYALAVLVGAAETQASTNTGTEAGAEAGTNRRRFLSASLATAGVAVLAGFGGRLLQANRFNAEAARAKVVLPPASNPEPVSQAGFDLGKSGVPFQTPADRFYRIDTALVVPQLDPDTWSLRIHGKVNRELTLSYADLLARPLVDRWVTLTCVSNFVGGALISNALFRGVLLADLLREAGVSPEADQLVATSSDGMTIGSPTAVVLDGRDALLAVGMNGQPLPVEHGFPVRMVVPGLYGYVSACKWIVDLQATTFADHQAYWVRGGWAQQGPIKLASRIDRPSDSQQVAVGTEIPIAGVAWDQHVGVSRVEVRVDDEPWQQAMLAPVPSSDTWRQWVWLWTPRNAGPHRIRVRAYDGEGQPQDASNADPFPSGATGLHTITVHAR
jgi:DMSO/TMAO reductase YedYZ molybdopterin-dependent catalytic subunit